MKPAPDTLTHPFVLGPMEFYLACGTVTVDPSARKLVLIYDHQDQVFMLPRGRKDWGEPLEAAAARETFEESGVAATVVPVHVRTRQTRPEAAKTDPAHPLHVQAREAKFVEDEHVVVGGAKLTEPFAMMQHVQSTGAVAVVMWYIAVADCTVPPALGTQAWDEEYSTHWVAYEEAESKLNKEMYKDVVRKAMAVVKRMEIEDGEDWFKLGSGSKHAINGVQESTTIASTASPALASEFTATLFEGQAIEVPN